MFNSKKRKIDDLNAAIQKRDDLLRDLKTIYPVIVDNPPSALRYLSVPPVGYLSPILSSIRVWDIRELAKSLRSEEKDSADIKSALALKARNLYLKKEFGLIEKKQRELSKT